MKAMADVEVLRAACCVAGLDGTIDDRERQALDRLAEKAGVGAVSLGAMIETATENSNFYQEQFGVICADPDRTIKLLLAVAIVDEQLGLAERVIIQHFADVLGMTRQRCDQLIDAAKKELGSRSTQGEAT